MNFIPMLELLKDAKQCGYAVPSFCVWNAETALTVLSVADDMKSPVILMNGPGEFPLITPADLGLLAHALARRFAAPAALHLDHGNAFSQVEQCLAAGYTSVMLDFSAQPAAENTDALRRVVAMAHPLGVTVEGEIGHVGQIDATTTEGGTTSTLTVPAEAAAYVTDTGVDALAVSIGNAHGRYTTLPRFDFERLTQIADALPDIPLVLHGGSGTPEADLKRAIGLGIAKVNVATELSSTYRESLMSQWTGGRNLWAPLALAETVANMKPVVEKWIRLTGAEGRA